MRTFHTLTAHSSDWEDFDTLEQAKAGSASYLAFAGDDAEQVILIIADDSIVAQAYDIDDPSVTFPEMVGKDVDDI